MAMVAYHDQVVVVEQTVLLQRPADSADLLIDIDKLPFVGFGLSAFFVSDVVEDGKIGEDVVGPLSGIGGAGGNFFETLGHEPVNFRVTVHEPVDTGTHPIVIRARGASPMGGLNGNGVFVAEHFIDGRARDIAVDLQVAADKHVVLKPAGAAVEPVVSHDLVMAWELAGGGGGDARIGDAGEATDGVLHAAPAVVEVFLHIWELTRGVEFLYAIGPHAVDEEYQYPSLWDLDIPVHLYSQLTGMRATRYSNKTAQQQSGPEKFPVHRRPLVVIDSPTR